MKCHRIFCLARKDGIEAQKLFQRIFPEQTTPQIKYFEDNVSVLQFRLGIPIPAKCHYQKVDANKIKNRLDFAAALMNLKDN